eukprot:TRINITY_DN1552_c0_g1_i9.p1 TRINITY_DN1552_c0_g1~~TRINITY_DN1552_c0_g1_i9.p1  ORF type:complete len:287 (+),score=60.80 TRINITY_DN1552_c0_g1_i9:32-862(+)
MSERDPDEDSPADTQSSSSTSVIPMATIVDYPKGVIECGWIDADGNRVYKVHELFFGKEVEVFTALNDPFKRKLFKVSDLASRMGSSTNRISMTIIRKKNQLSGIFQASSFAHRPPTNTTSSGQKVKIGAYFLSVDACQQIISLYVSSTTTTTQTSNSASVSQTTMAVISSISPSGTSTSLSVAMHESTFSSTTPAFASSSHSVSFQRSSLFMANANSSQDDVKEAYPVVNKSEQQLEYGPHDVQSSASGFRLQTSPTKKKKSRSSQSNNSKKSRG